MSLEKSIKSGKEKRKQYYGSKSFDHTCRNHGSCSWCLSSRTIQINRENARSKDQIDEWFYYCETTDITDQNEY